MKPIWHNTARKFFYRNGLQCNCTSPVTLLKRVENFKYLGVILNEDNNHQTDLQERIETANKTHFMLQKFFRNKIYI